MQEAKYFKNVIFMLPLRVEVTLLLAFKLCISRLLPNPLSPAKWIKPTHVIVLIEDPYFFIRVYQYVKAVHRNDQMWKISAVPYSVGPKNAAILNCEFTTALKIVRSFQRVVELSKQLSQQKNRTLGGEHESFLYANLVLTVCKVCTEFIILPLKIL